MLNLYLCFQDRDGHGPQFLSHMTRINKESGTRITVSVLFLIFLIFILGFN